MASMGKKVVWRKNSEFAGKADAEGVQKEINLIASMNPNEKCEDKELVAYAADHPQSESHKCFEWDNKKAADSYRLHQAARIKNQLQTIIIPLSDLQKEEVLQTIEIPIVYQTSITTVTNHSLPTQGEGHKDISIILSSQADTEALEARMYQHLKQYARTFKERYVTLPAAAQYIQALEDIVSQIPLA